VLTVFLQELMWGFNLFAVTQEGMVTKIKNQVKNSKKLISPEMAYIYRTDLYLQLINERLFVTSSFVVHIHDSLVSTVK
jgi:hypothetical protein